MLTKKEKLNLQLFAEEIRLRSIESMAAYGTGHVGGVLSLAEAVAVLYGKVLNINPKNPRMQNRDRVVLSKGHCGPVLYSALALKGYFPIEALSTLNADGSMLPSHCNMLDTPGIDVSTGSLGQGASLAAGIATGMKMQNLNARCYLFLGDGECNEGQVWEMALYANQQKLDKLVAFVDWNHQQLDGWCDDICALGDLGKKFAEFGWFTQTVNGHDVEAIYSAIENTKEKTSPSMIILDSIKGKGWSAAEGKEKNHHMPITKEMCAQASAEINARIAALNAAE